MLSAILRPTTRRLEIYHLQIHTRPRAIPRSSKGVLLCRIPANERGCEVHSIQGAIARFMLRPGWLEEGSGQMSRLPEAVGNVPCGRAARSWEG